MTPGLLPLFACIQPACPACPYLLQYAVLGCHKEDDNGLEDQCQFAGDAGVQFHGAGPDLQRAEKQAHQHNAQRPVLHDHGHQHTVKVKARADGFHKPAVNAVDFQKAYNAAQRT
jgi:hypothetical protein